MKASLVVHKIKRSRRIIMMRLIVIAGIFLLMVSMVAPASAADNSLKQNTFGLSIGFNNGSLHDAATISGRYFLMDTMALTADLGFESQSGDRSDTFFALAVGIRKYLKKADFASFVGASIRYENDRISTRKDMIGIFGDFGAEYFFAKEFSVEGAIGIGISQVEDKTFNPSQDYTVFGTTVSGVRANFYF
jgi:hypothetical protein